MDGPQPRSAYKPGGEHWALRLAGAQDDANGRMWARNVRAGGLSLARLAGALDRRRWLALGIFVALLAPAAAWVWSMPARYLGSTRLLVKDPAPPGSRDVAASSQMQETIAGLRDPELLHRASAALGLGVEGVSRLAQDLRIAAIPQSSLIAIELEDEDPQFAAGAVKAIGDFYLRPEPPQAKLLSDEERAEVEVYQKMLDAARQELARIEADSGLKGLAAERDSNDSRASELESEQASIERRVRDAETRLNLLERQAAELPSNVGPRAANRALAERLRALSYELQRQRNGLLTRYEANDALVREIDLRLSAAKEALDRSEVSGASLAGAVTALHAEIDEQQLLAQADVSRWRARERELNAAHDALSSKQSRLRRLADRRAELEQTIATAEQRLDALRGDGGVPSAPKLHISVIEPARALPIDRQQPLLIGFAALIALCAALAAALAVDGRKKPVAYIADIAAATGAPVLCLTEETHSHVS